MLATATTPTDDMRRKAASAAADMFCQFSPAHAEFRTLGRHRDELHEQMIKLHAVGVIDGALIDEMAEIDAHLLTLAELILERWPVGTP